MTPETAAIITASITAWGSLLGILLQRTSNGASPLSRQISRLERRLDEHMNRGHHG